MLREFGLVNVAAVSLDNVTVGDVDSNFVNVLAYYKEVKQREIDIIVFPELCITGYSCQDLFRNSSLLKNAFEAVELLAEKIEQQLVIVGLPCEANGRIYNCAAVLNQGKIIGIIPKSYLPNYREYEEQRFFTPGKGIVDAELNGIPFGTDLLFSCDGAVVGVEICEDLWVPNPPSSQQAINGANIICNLSASNDVVGKDRYRRELVSNQSGRCVAGYVYACAGPSESTTDMVMSGHNIIASNGKILVESPPFSKENIIGACVDIQELATSKYSATSIGQCDITDYKLITFELESTNKVYQAYDPTPFIPKENVQETCEHILNNQTESLYQYLRKLPRTTPVSINISGGLDSTLALLVTVRAFDKLGRDRKDITALTLPGLATSKETKTYAKELMEVLGVTAEEIDISFTCHNIFSDLNHGGEKDLTYQNVQARYRTLLGMSKGFLIGTGDMSELLLGWCTYNGDQSAMYNVNANIPKTLVKTLVQHCVDYTELGTVLTKILDMPYTAELVENQSTEDELGPYVLHDFFAWHFLHHGFSLPKVYELARITFDYEDEFIEKTLRTFITRFFANRFKQLCVPSSSKVGTLSISPRGDLRLPSDVSPDMMLDELDFWIKGIKDGRSERIQT